MTRKVHCLLLAFIAFGFALHAQQSASVGYFITDLKGEPLTNKYEKITEGSPFFSNEWLKGKAVTSDGKTFDNLSLKVNLLENDIHFLGDKQEEMIMRENLRTVELTNVATGDTYFFYRPAKSCVQNPKTWFQVIDSGKVWLLKMDSRSVTEIKPYGSATTEEKIMATIRYYLLTGGDCRPVKSTQEAFEILSQLKPGFTEKPTGKSNPRKMEEDLKNLVGKYNQQ